MGCVGNTTDRGEENKLLLRICLFHDGVDVLFVLDTLE